METRGKPEPRITVCNGDLRSLRLSPWVILTRFCKLVSQLDSFQRVGWVVLLVISTKGLFWLFSLFAFRIVLKQSIHSSRYLRAVNQMTIPRPSFEVRLNKLVLLSKSEQVAVKWFANAHECQPFVSAQSYPAISFCWRTSVWGIICRISSFDGDKFTFQPFIAAFFVCLYCFFSPSNQGRTAVIFLKINRFIHFTQQVLRWYLN